MTEALLAAVVRQIEAGIWDSVEEVLLVYYDVPQRQIDALNHAFAANYGWVPSAEFRKEDR